MFRILIVLEFPGQSDYAYRGPLVFFDMGPSSSTATAAWCMLTVTRDPL